MTAAQADILMAVIARVSTQFGRYRDGWPGVAENQAEAAELQQGLLAFRRELVDSIRAIEAQQPEVVARWRRERGREQGRRTTGCT